MSDRGATRTRAANGASRAREPDLSYELRLMADPALAAELERVLAAPPPRGRLG